MTAFEYPDLESPTVHRPALVLFSGGQDSTTCLFWALRRFERVEAIGFDYGQRHAVELEQARRIADLAGIRYDLVNLERLLGDSALTDSSRDVNAPHERAPDLPASFVPGRNALFLTVAGSMAYSRGVTDLVGGMCQTDYSGYPDCRIGFIRSVEQTLSLAMDADFLVHTPLMHLNKAETWKLARDLGEVQGHDVLEIVREMSHTDYHGNRSERHEWGYGRLDNPASVLRAKGYDEAVQKGWV